VRERVLAAIDGLRKAGATVDEVHPEFTLADSHALYRQLLDPVVIGAASPRVIEQMQALAAMPGDDPMSVSARNAIARHAEWLVASEKRMRLRAALEKFFVDYDVILSPVVPVTAIAHDHRTPQFIRTIQVDGETRSYLDIMTRVSLATVAGNPATAVPVGRTPNGLPVGMQIIGPYLEDLTPIDVAGRVAEVLGGFEPPPGY
jgi:amidase